MAETFSILTCLLQIGLAVGDIEAVQKNAELKRLKTQVKITISPLKSYFLSLLVTSHYSLQSKLS